MFQLSRYSRASKTKKLSNKRLAKILKKPCSSKADRKNIQTTRGVERLTEELTRLLSCPNVKHREGDCPEASRGHSQHSGYKWQLSVPDPAPIPGAATAVPSAPLEATNSSTHFSSCCKNSRCCENSGSANCLFFGFLLVFCSFFFYFFK